MNWYKIETIDRENRPFFWSIMAANEEHAITCFVELHPGFAGRHVAVWLDAPDIITQAAENRAKRPQCVDCRRLGGGHEDVQNVHVYQEIDDVWLGVFDLCVVHRQRGLDRGEIHRPGSIPITLTPC